MQIKILFILKEDAEYRFSLRLFLHLSLAMRIRLHYLDIVILSLTVFINLLYLLIYSYRNLVVFCNSLLYLIITVDLIFYFPLNLHLILHWFLFISLDYLLVYSVLNLFLIDFANDIP